MLHSQTLVKNKRGLPELEGSSRENTTEQLELVQIHARPTQNLDVADK
jgi:hypothetical protein